MPLLPPRHALIPMIIACALFMENLDSTVIATALPVIAKSLGENPLRLNLAITSYLLSLAVFIPLSGWMADRFGARTVFRSAILVFTIGSVCCALVHTLPELVLARVLQGLGGAMMTPVGRLVILRTIPKADLVNAMAYLTVPALIGPVFGPPLGGFIVTYWSWRWIFLINVPIGVLGMVLATVFIENTREQDLWKFDLAGFLMTGIGLAGLVFGFEAVGRGVLPSWIVATLLGGGIGCLVIYALHARMTPQPIVDLTLFRIPTFRAAILGGSLFRMSIGALPFLLPLMLQLGFGLSAFHSGLLTFASAAGAMTMKFTAGPIIRLFGYRRVLLANTVISAGFLMSYSLFQPTTPHMVIFLGLLAGGFFRSLQFTCTNTLSYANVGAPQMSRATTISSMAQQLSVSFGVGAGALMLHVTLALHGGESLTAGDFAPAFLGVGLFALLPLTFFVPLGAQAGAELSGRKAAAERQQPAE
ncbi:MAG TPA: DHA2 family efflux MFS transporter permease subunit [Candidatus Sulfotelmatobacter sp.]|nr:DHA2 family efflux MFS transporter permease subunit [Candidatus Sulfotelmatobacter sp.]